ncbi:serine/threonine-protein kinase D3-like isoform X2 [Histomonas meleagridis]|uniref:serine/threonine-protein kinase D3-like isoform X2 n=1 Tax=Histomonas meleagridis TaxID=135588 RepID=UPI0035597E77|nr:serine/threonine-protein kinase D3-like isoform X2 [Histomonas meleagridis]KAH0807117.1 serine/threonine-protein kinase D3-like isoform X2 [Histomonas meleagridis]
MEEDDPTKKTYVDTTDYHQQKICYTGIYKKTLPTSDSVVVSAFYRGTYVAIKFFKNDTEHISYYQNELNVLHWFSDYQYVIDCIDTIISTDNEYIGIVTDQQEENLYQCFKRDPFDEKKACQIMYQVLVVLNHMHSSNFVHCNLNYENILLSFSNNLPIIHLTGFAFSKEIRERLPYSCKEGSHMFLAPEVIKNSQYSFSADIWSAGIILFYCLTGQIPFNRNDDIVITLQISNGIIINTIKNAKISPEAKDLLLRMTCLNPEMRITASEALEHKWFKDNLIIEYEIFIKEKVSNKYSFIDNDQYDDQNGPTE